jgi:3-methyladenine DNA glycosylase AlkD
MLREVGKRNQEVLEIFLKERYKTMPRTMLRYAIEKFPEDERKKYLKGEI